MTNLTILFLLLVGAVPVSSLKMQSNSISNGTAQAGTAQACSTITTNGYTYPDNELVFDGEERNGWTAHQKNWDDSPHILTPWSACMQTNGFICMQSHQCSQNGGPMAFFSGNPDKPASISRRLTGCGRATLQFGNCWWGGQARAYKNGVEIGVQGFGHSNAEEVEFDYGDQDEVSIATACSGNNCNAYAYFKQLELCSYECTPAPTPAPTLPPHHAEFKFYLNNLDLSTPGVSENLQALKDAIKALFMATSNLIKVAEVTLVQSSSFLETTTTGLSVEVVVKVLCEEEDVAAVTAAARGVTPTEVTNKAREALGISSIVTSRIRFASDTIGGRGDPHMTNIKGEKFNINRQGYAPLVSIASDGMSHLEVMALVEGAKKCGKKMFMASINGSGSWLERNVAVTVGAQTQDEAFRVTVDGQKVWSPPSQGYQPPATDNTLFNHAGKFSISEMSARQLGLGPAIELRTAHDVKMKIVRPLVRHTAPPHLNFDIQGLQQLPLSFKLGGLLGEDDHSNWSARDQDCGTNFGQISQAEGSIASAH